MELLSFLNDILWTYVLVFLLVGCALYFTVFTKGVQFRFLRDMLRVIGDKPDCESEHSLHEAAASHREISSFQAFAVALSSRVGTGNLAGVASAIFVGGPGAVFWMWVMALFGAATSFVESTLAQLYKRKGEDSFYGGPAYYMTHGLHLKWMGILFAVLIVITFGMANQIVQSNTLYDAVNDTIGVDKQAMGVGVAVITLFIIFGGIQRISRFASVVVPFMAVGYLLLAIYIIGVNIHEIPRVFRMIFDGAFGMNQVVGGAFGAAVLNGVKRGLFSNEAGEGSAPNAAATAETSHPVKQGLLQALGVFADTIVVCSCTAFIILISSEYDSGRDGILLTSAALTSEVGSVGKWFLTIAITLFAYTTLIANSFYGESNIRFISQKKWPIWLFRLFTGVLVFLGSIVTLEQAWAIVDISMGVMTLTNLIAIVILFPQVRMLLNNYISQRRKGKNPVFHKSMMPDIEKDLECWD